MGGSSHLSMYAGELVRNIVCIQRIYCVYRKI